MEKTITKYRTLCQILIKCACLANLSVRVGSRFAFAMERGEESPMSCVPPVDCVGTLTVNCLFYSEVTQHFRVLLQDFSLRIPRSREIQSGDHARS